MFRIVVYRVEYLGSNMEEILNELFYFVENRIRLVSVKDDVFLIWGYKKGTDGNIMLRTVLEGLRNSEIRRKKSMKSHNSKKSHLRYKGKNWGRPKVIVNKFDVWKKYEELGSIRKTAKHFKISKSKISQLINETRKLRGEF
jgi:DNA invertase Pin-like site-specific DNA recombinase